ncbi:diguanylate cyclase domain-containing protein, partial [uncultured Helicobacter sp.]
MMDLNGLDLDIGNNDFFGGLDDTELGIMKKGQQKQGGNAPVNLAETTQKLTSISKQALEALEKDAILPLPENFEAYFEKTLSQEQDEDIREKIRAMIESSNHDSRLIALEKIFNDNFATLKNVLEHLLVLCKHMSAMESNTKDRLAEITEITNPLGAQNAIKVLINEIRGFHKQIVKEADYVSRAYRDMYNKSSLAKNGAMYDTILGIYTRSFLMQAIETECKNGREFPRHCAVIVFAPSKEFARQLNDKNKLITAFKNIAKIVSKNIGAKDIVSYLGEGRFGMLLKNVQLEGAVQLCEDVIRRCKETNIFIGDMELQLQIVMGGVTLDVNKT